jgi:hypothetical protein
MNNAAEDSNTVGHNGVKTERTVTEPHGHSNHRVQYFSLNTT